MSLRSLIPIEDVRVAHVNTVDGTTDYESGVAYKAGTLVTYDDLNYVAATDIADDDTDTPDEAPTKWGLCPNAYTSGSNQGSGLETRVATLEDEMDTAQTDIDNLESTVADKVDKVAGKGLSENDYTDADAAIVAGIPDGYACMGTFPEYITVDDTITYETALNGIATRAQQIINALEDDEFIIPLRAWVDSLTTQGLILYAYKKGDTFDGRSSITFMNNTYYDMSAFSIKTSGSTFHNLRYSPASGNFAFADNSQTTHNISQTAFVYLKFKKIKASS